MKLRVEYFDLEPATSFGQVVSALFDLGLAKPESTYLTLDDGARGFIQLARVEGGYIAEWKNPLKRHLPSSSLARAQKKSTPGRLVETRFRAHENDVCTAADAVDLLLAFWLRQRRPRRFFWREVTVPSKPLPDE